ncbi:hypothetical protein AX16_002104 [Volvariella volvacea WC 439]|nr:hypothetical protein AX16_002104 [Volvariella volvacea WC 439]
MTVAAKLVDYSLYFVTGRELLPPGKDYYESLEESLLGGVTVVQIREKHAETQEFVEIARRSKEICDKYKVPVLVNDRIDVALAIGAAGVHLGQTDMPVNIARQLLPQGSIIGVSCNTVGQVEAAIKDNVDYIGIGAVWNTNTKQLIQPVVSVRGVGPMLELLDGTDIKAVAIGGIKSSNLLRTLHGTVSKTGHALDGVAVVSEIAASAEPHKAAERLKQVLKAFKAGPSASLGIGLASLVPVTPGVLLDGVEKLMVEVKRLNPLVHQITNNVVATQSANVTLAVGGSPIMATAPQEMVDLAAISSSVLVNIGTLTTSTAEGMLTIGAYANKHRKPAVLDPVGMGATALRKQLVMDLLNSWQASVIKGNAGELAALMGSSEVLSKGVDSAGPGFKDPAGATKELARRERSTIVLTGPVDYLSDGQIVVSLANGHELLGKITGSGCIAGSCIATFCGVAAAVAEENNIVGRLVRGDMLLGSIAGILVLTVAAELAAERSDVKGAGTFLPALIDELWTLTPEVVRKRAKIAVL